MKSDLEGGVEEVKITENATAQETITKDTQETQILQQVEIDIVSSKSDVIHDLPAEEIKIQGIQSQIEALKKLPKTLTSPKVPEKLDVSTLKMDILNVLKEARNTIAGLKYENAIVPQTKSEADVIQSERTSPTTAKLISKCPEKMSKHDVSLTESNPGDDFDMFSLEEQQENVSSIVPPVQILAAPTCEESNCDDGEGYYRASVGEILNARYRVLGTVGKGVFSTVLRCLDLHATPAEDSDTNSSVVAIKLIRNNDTMRNASQTEIKVLKTLGSRDPKDRKHCVRLLDHFEHRNHISLVFEPMQMNLREAMKKFGGKSGIAIQAVRIFARHLLIALSHLEACDVVHAGAYRTIDLLVPHVLCVDVKPDNILLDDKQTTVKVCDFGSAFFRTDGTHHDPTPYLVSRFYRAPEIILGFPYDKAVDMWSIGCCLFEMFTGQVLFPGSTNNEMLKLFMQLKGKLPSKFIKRHRTVYLEQFQMEPHFTDEMRFISRETDRVTGRGALLAVSDVRDLLLGVILCREANRSTPGRNENPYGSREHTDGRQEQYRQEKSCAGITKSAG